jgi:hypothetical protein
MWAIDNRTPYKADSTWGRDRDGVHEWIVAVKGTFDIKPDGQLELADEQLEPLLAPEYNGEDGMSSLRYDADLVAPKPTTDVLINGTAYAPNGRPSTEFLASARVGSVEKTIRVVGNRVWKQSAFSSKPSSAEPVTEIPIIYERAYGGFDQTDPDPKNQYMDARNPVGCGAAAKSDHRIGQPVPNFEYPSGSLEKAGPAGFGAIDSFWSPRRELNGTYDKAWEEKRRPLLPEDWDPRSLLCSPEDQRPDSDLRGGELVGLTNLTPGGMLRFALPKVYLTFSTRFDTGRGTRTEEHRGQLATVIVEPDYPRVIMVWSTSLTCRTDVDYLEETVVNEKPYS